MVEMDNGSSGLNESLEDIERQEAELAAKKAKLREEQTIDAGIKKRSDEVKYETQKPAEIESSLGTTAKDEISKQSAGILVLQWLTYAFWGWAILALAALLVNVLWYFIVDPTEGAIEFSPYGVAAVAVLLPISFVCDLFYKLHDGQDKTGASSVIMIFHAVIFALFAIGSLITSVFSAVQLITRADSIDETMVVVIGGFIMALVYLLTFLRTLKPKKLSFVATTYRVIIGLFALVLLLLAGFGPLRYSVSSKNDRLIDDSLQIIKNEIQDYADKEQVLPNKLNELQFDSYDDSAKTLIDRGLIDYRPNSNGSIRKQKTKPLSDSEVENFKSGTESSDDLEVFYYQLCVNYRYKGVDDNHYSGPNSGTRNQQTDTNKYSADLNISKHSAGDYCYKVRTGYDDFQRYNVYD